MKPIGVECTFRADGTVNVRRVLLDDRWQPVEQGRQWLDETGRHVLLMLPGEQVREIVLRGDSLRWQLMGGPAASPRLV